MKTISKISEINCVVMSEENERSLDIYFTLDNNRCFLNLNVAQIEMVVVDIDIFLSEVDCREWADESFLYELANLIDLYSNDVKVFAPKTFELRRKTVLTLFKNDHICESAYFFEHDTDAPMVLMDDHEICDLTGEEVDLSRIKDFDLGSYIHEWICVEGETDIDRRIKHLNDAAKELRRIQAYQRVVEKETKLAQYAGFNKANHLNSAEFAQMLLNKSLEAYQDLEEIVRYPLTLQNINHVFD